MRVVSTFTVHTGCMNTAATGGLQINSIRAKLTQPLMLAPIHLEAHVHTVCVHVSIVHVLVVREELHKAPRLHPWVDTWTGTTQACVEQPPGPERAQTNAVMCQNNLFEEATGATTLPGMFCGSWNFTHIHIF